MAQPKRRWSKERTHLKRSTWKLEEKNLINCPKCGQPILPHTACPECGYYDGKQVLEIKDKTKKDKKEDK